MDRHILIEAVSPCVDGGRYAAKGICGESCVVECDVFRDGHALVRAVLRWKSRRDTQFEEVPMDPLGNDRFRAEFPLREIGLHQFTIEAWTDHFGTFLESFEKKVKAGRDASVDIEEGIRFAEHALVRAQGPAHGV